MRLQFTQEHTIVEYSLTTTILWPCGMYWWGQGTLTQWAPKRETVH
jgi:hypothetical protein